MMSDFGIEIAVVSVEIEVDINISDKSCRGKEVTDEIRGDIFTLDQGFGQKPNKLLANNVLVRLQFAVACFSCQSLVRKVLIKQFAEIRINCQKEATWPK